LPSSPAIERTRTSTPGRVPLTLAALWMLVS